MKAKALYQSTPGTSAQGDISVDRFAIHSLCYRVDKGQLRVANRADDLADASTQIDPQAIFDYLYFHVIPSPRTIYKGIIELVWRSVQHARPTLARQGSA
jgi:hypothetical protein